MKRFNSRGNHSEIKLLPYDSDEGTVPESGSSLHALFLRRLSKHAIVHILENGRLQRQLHSVTFFISLFHSLLNSCVGLGLLKKVLPDDAAQSNEQSTCNYRSSVS